MNHRDSHSLCLRQLFGVKDEGALDESGRCRDGFSMETRICVLQLLQGVICQTGSFSDFLIHETAPGSFIHFHKVWFPAIIKIRQLCILQKWTPGKKCMNKTCTVHIITEWWLNTFVFWHKRECWSTAAAADDKHPLRSPSQPRRCLDDCRFTWWRRFYMSAGGGICFSFYRHRSGASFFPGPDHCAEPRCRSRRCAHSEEKVGLYQWGKNEILTL